MRGPLLTLCALDSWLHNQLRDVLREREWQLDEVRTLDAWCNHLDADRPNVGILQLDFAELKDSVFETLRECHQQLPHVPIVIIADTKLADEPKAIWTLELMDLGVRYVLFPPLTKVVLEDLVTGLMEATLTRWQANDLATSVKNTPTTIDLAEGKYEA